MIEHALLAALAFVIGFTLRGTRIMADFTNVNASLNRLDNAASRVIAVVTSPDADQPQIDAVSNRIEDVVARLEAVLPVEPTE